MPARSGANWNAFAPAPCRVPGAAAVLPAGAETSAQVYEQPVVPGAQAALPARPTPQEVSGDCALAVTVRISLIAGAVTRAMPAVGSATLTEYTTGASLPHWLARKVTGAELPERPLLAVAVSCTAKSPGVYAINVAEAWPGLWISACPPMGEEAICHLSVYVPEVWNRAGQVSSASVGKPAESARFWAALVGMVCSVLGEICTTGVPVPQAEVASVKTWGEETLPCASVTTTATW